jgi:hypothetical protein
MSAWTRPTGCPDVVRIDLVDPRALGDALARVDLDIGRPPLEAFRGLVDQALGAGENLVYLPRKSS